MSDAATIHRRKVRSAIGSLSIACGMLALGYAAVPLYDLFCRVTGFGGTTQVANAEEAAKVQVAEKQISIRFDANVSSALAWDFKPEHVKDTVALGARDMAIYLATNRSDKPLTGTAAYNVTPVQAGKYFNKVQCFCFTEQTIQPGETMRMPVLFYVDPAIMDDPEARDIEQITLSYTFYPSGSGDKGMDQNATGG